MPSLLLVPAVLRIGSCTETCRGKKKYQLWGKGAITDNVVLLSVSVSESKSGGIRLGVGEGKNWKRKYHNTP